jgi:hypothetical protein
MMTSEMDNSEPELKNFFNLREGVAFLRLSLTAGSKNRRIVAWRTFAAYWGWPLLTVSILEVFWHSIFHFVVGW